MLASVCLVLRLRQANAALEQSTNAITNFLGPSPFLSLCDACIFGSIALLEWIWNASCTRATDKTPGWSLTNYLRSDPHYHKWQFAKALEAAASRGDLRMVEWVFARFPGCEAPATVADGAERNGYLRVLRCLSAQTSPSHHPGGVCVVKSEGTASSGRSTRFSVAAVQKATENGELVKYLNEGLPLDDYARKIAIKHALSLGDFQLAEELLPIGRCLLDYAAGCPRVEMIELMLDCGYLRRDEALAASTVPDLARSRHLELAQQVVLLHSPLLESSKLWKSCWVRALYEAGMCGNISMLRWLVEHPMGSEALEELSEDRRTRDLFVVVAQRGHTETLDYLYRRGLACDFGRAMAGAIEGGQASSVKWLLANHTYRDNKSITTIGAIDQCAENGHLEILKVLHEVDAIAACKSDGTSSLWWSTANDPMYWAARGGHLEVLKWLHTNRKQKCGADTMDVAAKHGHLEVVKWLHANRTEGCTKNAMNGAAAGGHLDVVQWLHQNRSEGCGGYAMYDAAENNHFEIVKWLYENCPRSHERTAVDRALRSGHLQLACWLQQRFPEYEIGAELDLHKDLVTVSGPWDSANAFEVLLCLHTCYEEVLTKWFLQRLRENIAFRENRSPRLLTSLLKQWLEEQYPESS